eukprot:734380-Prymnesium_polylepis.1
MADVGPAAAAAAVLAACLLTGARTSVARSGMSVTAARSRMESPNRCARASSNTARALASCR